MVVCCNDQDLSTVLAYIADDYPKCLYLYLDILKYGPTSDFTHTWIQVQGGQICAVALSYHTALHIYSRDNNLIVPEFVELIDRLKPTIIIAAADTIEMLEPVLSKNGFLSEFGHIGEWYGDSHPLLTEDVVEAKDGDLPEVARLLYEDENIGASYSYDDLLEQMKERLAQGFVHSYVIRKENKPIAHVGTGAEISNICTIAYTIVSPQYRGIGLARQLYSQVCALLKNEGKRVFSIYYPEGARLFHHKMGFIDVCRCGKLYKSIS